MTKSCERCGGAFTPLRSDARFCSDRCRRATGRAAEAASRPLPPPGQVHAAVSDELEAMGASGSVDCALALRLARAVDDPATSAAGMVACAKELRVVLDRVRARFRASQETSIFDGLLAKREARRSGLTPLRPGAS